MEPLRVIDETETGSREVFFWRPLLTGSLARRACHAIQAIAADLRRAPEPGPANPSVGRGEAGRALFWSYLAQAGGGKDCEELALACVDRAIDAVAELRLSSTLYGGYPGVGWVVEHLRGSLLSADEGEDPGEEIGAALARYLERPVWNGEYDLLLGLAGLGVHALERLPRPHAAECLERVVGHLGALAERRPEGMAWRTPPERHAGDTEDAGEPGGAEPEDTFDVGVAHGAPGVVAVLAGACAGGVAVRRARPLLDAAVAWILAQKLADRSRSTFPDIVRPEGARPARLAWCYGDAGIAAVLYEAGRVVDEPAWQREALAIAVAAAAHSAETARVRDACLCHGSAGLGHLFNRLYQSSGDLRLRDAALRWFRHALDQRCPGEGVGGFSYRAYQVGCDGFRDEPAAGFLEGSAGIGLALLGALSPVEPQWDRLLLASLR